MSEWTDEAMDLWADYLERVRDGLRNAGNRDTDAVVRDLEDHASQAFAGSAEPVSGSSMRALIDRLGPPDLIAQAASDAGDTTVPRRRQHMTIVTRALAGSSLAALAWALVHPPALVGALPLSFILARAGIKTVEGESAAERWLFYPALVTGSLALCLLVALWPFALVLPVAATGGFVDAWVRERGQASWFGTTGYWAAAWAIAALAAGVWCSVLARVLRRHPSFALLLFDPFAGRLFSIATLARVLTITAGALAFTGAILLLILTF